MNIVNECTEHSKGHGGSKWAFHACLLGPLKINRATVMNNIIQSRNKVKVTYQITSP